MPRLPRLVVPGYPHHVTQCGSRRQQTFFDDDDHVAYMDMLEEQLPRAHADILAYCLMPNHVHLVVVPQGSIPWQRCCGEPMRAMHDASINTTTGKVTYGRNDFTRSSWTRTTCSRRRVTSS